MLLKLAEMGAKKVGSETAHINQLLLDRENFDSTGLENGIAVPHCRLPDLKEPFIFVGTCHDGVDFNAMDMTLSKIIFMIITPEDDPQSQLEIIAQIAGLFGDKENATRLLHCESEDQFIAFFNTIEVHE